MQLGVVLLAFTMLIGLAVTQNRVTIGTYKLTSQTDLQASFYSNYLIETRSMSDQSACMVACNQNSACRLLVFDEVSLNCSLFNAAASTCDMTSSTSANVYLRNNPSCGSGQSTDGWTCCKHEMKLNWSDSCFLLTNFQSFSWQEKLRWLLWQRNLLM